MFRMKFCNLYRLGAFIAIIQCALSVPVVSNANETFGSNENSTTTQSGVGIPLQPAHAPAIKIVSSGDLRPNVFKSIPLAYTILRGLFSFWRLADITPIDEAIILEDRAFRTVKMIYTKVGGRVPAVFDTEIAMYGTLKIMKHQLFWASGHDAWQVRDWWVQKDQQKIGEIEMIPYNAALSTSRNRTTMPEGNPGPETSRHEATSTNRKSVSIPDGSDIEVYETPNDDVQVLPEALVELIYYYVVFFMESLAAGPITPRWQYNTEIRQTATNAQTVDGVIVVSEPSPGSRVPAMGDIVDCLLEGLRQCASYDLIKGFSATCKWLAGGGTVAKISVAARPKS